MLQFFNLFKLCCYAFIVGIIASLSTLVLRSLVAFFHHLFFFGKISFVYNETLHTPLSPWGLWIVFVPMIGAVFVTWLIEHYAKDERGLSVPEIMANLYYQKGHIRRRVALSKTLASAISIGSGASIGREGPANQLGAAVGSEFANRLGLGDSERMILVCAGCAAATATMFDAPLAGIAFALELLLFTLNTLNILLIIIAIIPVMIVNHYYYGAIPIFDITHLFPVHSLTQMRNYIFLFIPFGIVLGILSVVYIRSLYWTGDVLQCLFKNAYIRHLLGMGIVGLMIAGFAYYTGHYYIQGLGFSTIQDLLLFIITNPTLLILLFFGKWAASCLSLGSGASGGIFSPCLFLGATLGALVGLLLQHWFPQLGISQTYFIIAGMAGVLGSAVGALLTAILLMVETTKDFGIIIPVMITVISACVVRKLLCADTIYTLKLSRKGIFIPQRY